MNNSPSATVCRGRTLLTAVWRAASHIAGRIERRLEPTGLSLPKLQMLTHLVEAGEPLPLGQLAGRSACAKSNITQLVDRLEADGLVRREPDPEDRRSVRAAITKDGLRAYEAAARAQSEVEAELLASLSPDEQQHLAALLERFREERV
jgi:DNA-binding MarR family transcriptional regulator